MKRIFLSILFCFVSLFSCLSLVSCGDDDENDSTPVSKTLVGSWYFRADEFFEDSGSFWEGQLVFKNDGTCIYSDGQIYDDGEKFIVDKYYFDGTKLKIVMFYDDYIEGVIEWKGNDVVYHYHWGDAAGDWSDKERYTMMLTRLK